MTRTISDEGLQLLKQWEGLRLAAYKDVGGVWTIGYGSTFEVKLGDIITSAEATRRLMRDLAKFELVVNEAVQVSLPDNQFAALVSFAYNVGAEAFRTSTLLRKLNAGGYESVPGELARWNKVTIHGKRTESVGLTNRRAAEIGLWAKGSFVASRDVAVVEPPSAVGQTAWVASIGAAVGVVTPALPAFGGLDWATTAVLMVGILVGGAGYLWWHSRRG